MCAVAFYPTKIFSGLERTRLNIKEVQKEVLFCSESTGGQKRVGGEEKQPSLILGKQFSCQLFNVEP